MTGTERRLSRSALYDLVWSTPMHSLAPRFGLSDVGLAKICKRASIPRPRRGYWAKLAVGKRRVGRLRAPPFGARLRQMPSNTNQNQPPLGAAAASLPGGRAAA